MNSGSLRTHRSLRAPWLVFVASALALALAACAPGTDVENNVQPTVVSVCGPPSCSDTLVIQGRYFGDGADGQRSYVLAGADVNGRGGVRVPTSGWAANRIEAPVPDNAGYGFLFVFVDGVRSVGIPVNLP